MATACGCEGVQWGDGLVGVAQEVEQQYRERSHREYLGEQADAAHHADDGGATELGRQVLRVRGDLLLPVFPRSTGDGPAPLPRPPFFCARMWEASTHARDQSDSPAA